MLPTELKASPKKSKDYPRLKNKHQISCWKEVRDIVLKRLDFGSCTLDLHEDRKLISRSSHSIGAENVNVNGAGTCTQYETFSPLSNVLIVKTSEWSINNGSVFLQSSAECIHAYIILTFSLSMTFLRNSHDYIWTDNGSVWSLLSCKGCPNAILYARG